MKHSKAKRFEITCTRCGFTKEWTQKIFDRHLWLVHNFRNEQKIGQPSSAPQLFHLST